MTSKGKLLKLNLYLYIIIYRNMKSIKDLGKLIEKWRQFYYFNFSYEKHLEMLIALHIRLLLMSYNSGGMSLGDSEINYDFFWSFMTSWFLIELFSFACHLQMSKYMYQKPRHSFIKKLYFGFFQTFKGYMYIWEYMCVFVCIFYFTVSVFVMFSPQDFNIIPGGFGYLPGEKIAARSHPEKSFKIWNFSRWVKQSQPCYWDRVFMLPVFWQLLLRNGKIPSKCLFWYKRTQRAGKLFHKHFNQLWYYIFSNL